MQLQKNQPATKNNSQQPGSRWLERRWVLAVFGVVALALAYAFVSWAIDSGSLLDYALAILLVIVGVRDLYAAVRGPKKVTTGPSSHGKPTSPA